jgi:hypothetical protein
MSIIKVRWSVNELDNVLTLFDVQKVYWSDTETGTYVEITTEPTRVALVAGQTSYYYDDTAGDTSKWYKISYYNSDTTQESDLSGAIQGLSGGSERYATLTQLRTEGLPGDATTDVTDAQALILLERASELVEKITGNIFYEVTGTYTFDGNNSYLLHLPLAILEVTSLKINNETTALETTDYRVYNNRSKPQDNRYNPKIELRRSTAPTIYTGYQSRKFLKGYDQVIEGSFGFLEPDGSVPPTINECVMAIVMTTWQDLFTRFGANSGGGGGPGPMMGPLKRERTDDHEVEWWQTDTGATEQGMIVPQYVHGRLKLFRAPPTMMVTNYRFDSAEFAT